MNGSRFGTHTLSVEVSDRVSAVRRSCAVKVAPVPGAVIAGESGELSARFGDDLEVSAGVKAAVLTPALKIYLPILRRQLFYPISRIFPPFPANGITLPADLFIRKASARAPST